MFLATDTEWAPWTVVKSNDKKCARLEAMRHVLHMFAYDDKDRELVTAPDGLIHGAAAAVQTTAAGNQILVGYLVPAPYTAPDRRPRPADRPAARGTEACHRPGDWHQRCAQPCSATPGTPVPVAADLLGIGLTEFVFLGLLPEFVVTTVAAEGNRKHHRLR